jgi:predicted transposase YbfD/YdcC
MVMAILSVVGGCGNWEEMELWCNYRRSLFLELLGTAKIPSHDTFRRVFMLLSVDKFEHCFAKMISYVTSCKEEVIRDIIALDGKALRGSKRNITNKTALHIVNAWSVKQGMVLGQKQVDKKSNEIKAIPELLEILNVKNNVITIDAAGTQKKIASKIIDQEGDYVLALKANHPKAYTEVVDYFNKEIFTKSVKPNCDNFSGEKHHRTERRRYFIVPATKFSQLHFKGIKNVIALESIRSEKNKKVSTQIRYYIASCQDSDKFITSCIRSHWHVENKLHWCLDVNFREDQNRSTDDNAAINLSILRKIAINALRNEKSFKKSIPLKRRKAGMDNEYLKKIIRFE